MLPSNQVDAGKLSRWGVRCYAVVISYFVVLVQESASGQRMVSVTPLRTEPPVELTRLRFDLLDKYQKTVRPLRNQTDVLPVKVFYDIQHVVSMDEKYQTLTVNGRLKLFWTDEFLTWNPKNYSGINLIRFSAENIWWPQILIQFNVMPFTLYDKKRSPPITVRSNGSVEWFPDVHCAVPCSADYRHYPFDSHNCSVIIVPQVFNHSGFAVLPYRFQEPNVRHFGTEWTVSDVIHEAEWDHEKHISMPHQQVRIRIFLDRVSRMYRYICVIPTLVSMVSLLFGFWLLPTETSRYLIGCSNIVVLSMLLQHMALTIPAGRVVPLIAQYSASCLCMSAVFILVTVAVRLLRERGGKAPEVLLRLARFTLSHHLCIYTFAHQSPPLTEEDSRPHLGGGDSSRYRDRSVTGGAAGSAPPPPPTVEEEEELQRRKAWLTISVLADRVFFWCFAFIFTALLAVLAAV